jgi:hypothetical protein
MADDARRRPLTDDEAAILSDAVAPLLRHMDAAGQERITA